MYCKNGQCGLSASITALDLNFYLIYLIILLKLLCVAFIILLPISAGLMLKLKCNNDR